MTEQDKVAISKYRLERAEECLHSTHLLEDDDLYLSASNRLYYAVFSAMRALLALESVDFKKHSGVISYFREKYIKTGEFDVSYSNLIRDTARIRTESDYGDLYIPNKEEIRTLLLEAEDFVRAVKLYLSQIDMKTD